MTEAGFSFEAPHQVVIGGGFSGLYTAYALLAQGERVLLFEAATVGGLIQTRKTPWGLIETGANGFLASRRLLEVLADLRLDYILPKSTAKARYIHSRRGIRRWPLSPMETLITGFRFAFSFLTGRLAPRAGETVFAWGERCLGQAAATQLVLPGVQGIYATTADDLSATLILSRFLGPNRDRVKSGAVRGTLSFAGGMTDVIEALFRRLQKNPRFVFQQRRITEKELLEFQQNPNVTRIWVATPPAVAAQLLTTVAPDLSACLQRLPTIPVLSVTAFFEKGDDLRGFGVLNHPDLKSDVLGVLFNNEIFEGRGSLRSETWILRAAGTDRLGKLSKESLQNYLEMTRAKHFGRRQAARHLEVQAWPQGLPHFGATLEDIQGEFQKDSGKIRLVGNYVRGIGLTRIIEFVDERIKA